MTRCRRDWAGLETRPHARIPATAGRFVNRPYDAQGLGAMNRAPTCPRSYPFTAPSCIPLTKNFCPTTNSTISGIIAITEAAIRRVVSRP